MAKRSSGPSEKQWESAPGKREWYVWTKHEAAEFFGITYNHFNQLKCFRDYEKTEWGYYLPELVKRRHQQILRSPQARRPDGSFPGDEEPNLTLQESLNVKRKLEKEEDIRRKRRENDVREGLLVPMADVEHALVVWAVRFRTPLLGLANRIMALVPGSAKASAKRMVQDEVRAALVRIRDMPYTGERIDELIEQEYRELAKKKKSAAARATRKKAAKKSAKKR